jgi:hypothetical protein
LARLLRHLDDELYVQYGLLCFSTGTDYPEIRDVFDPLVHMKPREPIGSAPPLEPRRAPVPVTTAG